MNLKMKKMYKMILTLVAVLSQFSLFAQTEVEMADTMRSDGKIYVVVAIILVIFLGLIGYLILMDRKITRLEKKITEKDLKR
jgi:CcmD family protein